MVLVIKPIYPICLTGADLVVDWGRGGEAGALMGDTIASYSSMA